MTVTSNIIESGIIIISVLKYYFRGDQKCLVWERVTVATVIWIRDNSTILTYGAFYPVLLIVRVHK